MRKVNMDRKAKEGNEKHVKETGNSKRWQREYTAVF